MIEKSNKENGIIDAQSGIESQIEELDRKIRDCQKNNYWKVESALLNTRNRLKMVLKNC